MGESKQGYTPPFIEANAIENDTLLFGNLLAELEKPLEEVVVNGDDRLKFSPSGDFLADGTQILKTKYGMPNIPVLIFPKDQSQALIPQAPSGNSINTIEMIVASSSTVNPIYKELLYANPVVEQFQRLKQIAKEIQEKGTLMRFDEFYKEYLEINRQRQQKLNRTWEVDEDTSTYTAESGTHTELIATLCAVALAREKGRLKLRRLKTENRESEFIEPKVVSIVIKNITGTMTGAAASGHHVSNSSHLGKTHDGNPQDKVPINGYPDIELLEYDPFDNEKGSLKSAEIVNEELFRLVENICNQGNVPCLRLVADSKIATEIGGIKLMERIRLELEEGIAEEVDPESWALSRLNNDALGTRVVLTYDNAQRRFSQTAKLVNDLDVIVEETPSKAMGGAAFLGIGFLPHFYAQLLNNPDFKFPQGLNGYFSKDNFPIGLEGLMSKVDTVIPDLGSFIKREIAILIQDMVNEIPFSEREQITHGMIDLIKRYLKTSQFVELAELGTEKIETDKPIVSRGGAFSLISLGSSEDPMMHENSIVSFKIKDSNGNALPKSKLAVIHWLLHTDISSVSDLEDISGQRILIGQPVSLNENNSYLRASVSFIDLIRYYRQTQAREIPDATVNYGILKQKIDLIMNNWSKLQAFYLERIQNIGK